MMISFCVVIPNQKRQNFDASDCDDARKQEDKKLASHVPRATLHRARVQRW
jgi:hypothetical protein